MDRLAYTALSGINAAMNRQRVVANNLANMSTPGFRAESFSVTPATLKGPSIEARSLANGGVRGADMSGGPVAQTGNPLDIALQGKSMLALQGENGAQVYSRRGDLSISPSGVLQNGDGLPVMGESGGAITVPLGQHITLGQDGSVFARDPGAGAEAEPQNIGRIKIASIEGSTIAKGTDGFFRVVGGGILPQDQDAKIDIGALEQSNVNSAAVLVDMIEAQRSFEQRSKMLGTLRELDQSGSKLMSIR